MTDIASDLRARFDFAVLWFHEKCELDPNSLLDDEHTIVDLTDDEAKAVKILETLSGRTPLRWMTSFCCPVSFSTLP
jgi:hypothetical protein